MKISIPSLYKITLPILVLLLASCAGESDSGSSTTTTPSSGSSGSPAPSSIIGFKLVETVGRIVSVTGSNVSTVERGDTVTYSFINPNQILGAGLNTLPTTSWSYSKSGSTGTARLNYTVGKSVETLTFSTPTSGIYTSVSTLNSGSGVTHTGTFIVSTVSGGSTGSTGSTGGTTGSSCTAGSNGDLTIYTNEGDEGNITVQVDGSTVGTLSANFPSGSPTCGSSSSGAITRSLSPGTHRVTASSQGSSTWDGNVTVTSCGCLNYRLNE